MYWWRCNYVSTGGSEAARFNSSQTLLIGKTAEDFNTVGFQVKSSGQTCITRNQGTPAFINRKGDTGGLIDFRDDNANCGVIGTVAGDLFIANAVDVGLYFDSTTTDHVAPCNIDGSKRHAAIDMGSSGTSFRNYYGLQYMGAGGHTGYMHFTGSHSIRFVNNGSERARFASDGAFMLGQTTTSAPGSGNTTAGITLRSAIGDAFFSRADGDAGYFNRNNNGSVITFSRSGTAVGNVAVTTTNTAFNTSSDIRLKEAIEPLQATDKLMAMNPVSYNWKADPDGPRSMGFIAQQMADVMPEAVSTGDDEDAMMSMDYGRITPILVSALQDAMKRIESLEAKVAALEAK
jgi:hypothetical protein